MASTWATVMASGPGRRNVAGVTRVPRRMRSVSRARPASVTQASVGPGSPGPSPIAEVVVGPEERVEAERLGLAGDRQQVVVGRALLGLGEDAQCDGHRPNLPP